MNSAPVFKNLSKDLSLDKHDEITQFNERNGICSKNFSCEMQMLTEEEKKIQSLKDKILKKIKFCLEDRNFPALSKTKDELLDSVLEYFSLYQIRVNIIYRSAYNLANTKITLAGVKDWDHLRCFLGKLAILMADYPEAIKRGLMNRNMTICQEILISSSESELADLNIFQLNKNQKLEFQLYEFMLNSTNYLTHSNRIE